MFIHHTKFLRILAIKLSLRFGRRVLQANLMRLGGICASGFAAWVRAYQAAKITLYWFRSHLVR